MAKPDLPPRGQSRALMRAARRLLSSAGAVVEANPAHHDAVLLAACVEYGEIQLQIDRLFEGHTGIQSEQHRGERHGALLQSARPVLTRICRTRALSIEGHRARAAVFIAYDAGDLSMRARHGFLEDRLMFAIVSGLVRAE